MKIRAKINFSFLAIFILVSSSVGLIVGIYTTNLVKNNIYSYLTSSSRARAEHIRTFIQDQEKTAVILAAASVYLDFLREPVDSIQYPIIKEKIIKRFARTIEADPEIYEVLIIGKDGKTLASSNPQSEGEDESDDEYFIEGKKGVFFKDVYFVEPNDTLTYAIATPINDSDGSLLGVSLLRYKPDHFFSIVKSENGLGETEENFLINKDKFFITPSRFFGEDVILKQKVETKNANDCFDAEEIKYVKNNGYTGFVETFGSQIVEAKDYRNINVLATHAYIPETGWCLITKADKVDAMSFKNTLINIFLSIFFIAGILYLIIGFVVSQKITNPIMALIVGAKKIEHGDFDYRTNVKTKDEIGELSESFDKMAEAVEQSRAEIDQKVKEQTKEIADKAKSLTNQQKATLNILEDVKEEKNKAEGLAAIVRDAEEPIVGKKLDGTIITWNHGAENLYGYTAEEIVGRSIKIIVPKDHQREIDQILGDIQNGKIVDHFQTVRTKKDGSLVDVSISVSPIKDADGKIIGASTITLDITKEKQIDRAKTEFVSLASHQLRTPLSAINWYTEMLLAGDAGKINKEQKQYLDEIYHGNQRMVELVNALLNVSRLELGTFMIEPELLLITDLASEVIKELKPLLDKKGVKLKSRFSPKLPKIMLDSKLTTIILQNLLSNAVKYNKDNGQVELNIYIKDKYLEIKVVDTGLGIPKSQQSKIFDKLFRADNVRATDTEGTGLGLYIVKSIVENTGGKIWFDSLENKGTTFYVDLPLSGMTEKKGDKKLS